MLARRLDLDLADRQLTTPLLIPSFSSKGAADLAQIYEALNEYLEDAYLISAYDIHYKAISAPDFEPTEVVFLDSGGYEANKAADSVDHGYTPHLPEEWDQEQFHSVVSDWPANIATVLISYDHPRRRIPLSQQIDEAKELFNQYPTFASEFLVKPEKLGRTLAPIENIASHGSDLGCFDIVGVTENELGNTIFKRMRALSKLRDVLDASGHPNMPIHVLGSLDPISTPLYFIAGADIFDGLTWMRYSFLGDRSVYHQNSTILKKSIKEPFTRGYVTNLSDNLNHLITLTLQMKRFVDSQSFDSFGEHALLFKDAAEDLETATGSA